MLLTAFKEVSGVLDIKILVRRARRDRIKSALDDFGTRGSQRGLDERSDIRVFR